MRRIATFAAALSLLLTFRAVACADELIPWAPSLEQAQSLAAQRNQLVLLHFWAVDCPPCRALETNVFNQPEVAQAIAARYVPVKVNAREQAQLARRYNVDRWPTDIVITPSGQELHRTVSPQNSAQYAALFTTVAQRAGVNGPSVAQTAYQSGSVPTRTVGYGQGSAAGRDTASPQISYGAPSSAPNNPQNQVSPYGAAPQGGQYGGAAPNAQPANSPYGAPYGQPGNTASSYQSGPYGGAAPAQQFGTSPAPTAGQGSSPYGAGPTNPPAGNYTQNPPVCAAGGSRYGDAPPAGSTPPVAGGSQYRGGGSIYGDPAATAGNGATPVNGGGSRYSDPSVSPPAGNSSIGQQPISQPRPDATAEAGSSTGGAKTPPEPAMAGYCPVTLVDGQKWKKADKKFGAFHRNRLYLFAGAEEQQKFLANPDYYSPVLEGYDPIKYLDSGNLVDGRRDHGVFFNNRVYLFADEPTLQKFWSNPQHYVGLVEQATRNTNTQRR